MTNPVRPLTEIERTALRESIEAHGRILVPILVDQHGIIIDGHHRKQIADELGIDCPTDQIPVADEVERLAIAIETNAARRQLGLHERTALHTQLREAGWSLRRIAAVTGASKDTVQRDTAGVSSETPASVGRDGKSYPASRPAPALPSGTPAAETNPPQTPAGAGDEGEGVGTGAPSAPSPDHEAFERFLDEQPDVKRQALRNAVRSMRAATATVVADIDPDEAADLVDPDERHYEEATVSRQIAWLTGYRFALQRSGLTVMKGGRG